MQQMDPIGLQAGLNATIVMYLARRAGMNGDELDSVMDLWLKQLDEGLAIAKENLDITEAMQAVNPRWAEDTREMAGEVVKSMHSAHASLWQRVDELIEKNARRHGCAD